MPKVLLSINHKLIIISLLLIFLSSCVGVANVDQRKSKLIQNCQEMMGKSKAEVIEYLKSQGIMHIVHEEILADGDEFIILEKKLVKNRTGRNIDRVKLVFRSGKLAESEVVFIKSL